MRKSLLLTAILVAFLAAPALANNDTMMGNQAQNQNQVQNQGEDTEVRGQAMENEAFGDFEDGQGFGMMGNTSQMLQEMSEMMGEGNALGEQMQNVLQEQTQAQNQIQQELTKLQARSRIQRFFFGADYGAIKSLKGQLEQNQTRIQALTNLQTQLSNQSEITLVKQTVQALVDQNTALQEMVDAQEKSVGLFGWFFRLFSR